MNEKLEAFRKRLRGPEKGKPNWPFWVGSPTAWLALIISSATAFSTLIYHSDELSVAVNPIIWTSIPQVGVQVPRNITYVNSGSRPIAVQAIHLVAAQQKVKTDPIDCSHGQFDKIDIASDQTVVIKPYDTVTRKLAIDGTEQEVRTIKLTDLNKNYWIMPPHEPRVVVCLVVEIVASERYGWFKTIELNHEGRDDVYPLARPTPQYVIKRNTLWTFVGNDDLFSPLYTFISTHEGVSFP